MNLLLADDHSLFREALVQYIERAEPEAEIVLARDVHEVMDIMEEDPVLDLILLDMRMPGMDGLQGLKNIKKKYPAVPVALLSGFVEKKDVDAALQLGACGYFPKTLPGKTLMKGIKEITEGGNYIARDRNTGDIMPSYHDGGRKKKSSISLTPREAEVLSYLKQGASNKDIARALDLQIVTIKLHVRGICRKLGAKNRTQAALIAKELEL